MKPILTIMILIACSLNLCAQDKLEETLKGLTDNKAYEEVIKLYGSQEKDLSAKSLYYIGLSYYMKENDAKCLQYMDLSIKKDDKDPAPYYIKGSTLNYMEKYGEAAKSLRSAVSLNPQHALSYSGLGDAYYHLNKLDLALENFKKATEAEDCPDHAYSMLAQVYSEQNNSEKALESFYLAKITIDKTTDSYTNALYNIALYESLKGDHNKAEPVLLELLQLKPNDYRAFSKLIQVYYHNKEYEKAKPYRDKLYQAFKDGQLEKGMDDMFCFDQFVWKDKRIQAYERYQDKSLKGEIYRKHIFYVVNDKNEIEYKLQTEYSAISVELGGSKYLLCGVKGNTHSTYTYGYNDDFKYEDMKNDVLKVLEGKTKPSASSRPK